MGMYISNSIYAISFLSVIEDDPLELGYYVLKFLCDTCTS